MANWPFNITFSSNSVEIELHKLSVRNIGGTRVLVPGHQNSGAPTFFFGVFLMVFSNLCWQCSNKTRKCQEHINTLRKKEKLIFLMPILEIKTKNLFSAGKGTRVLVPGHQNSGAPSFFGGFLDGVLTFVLAMF